MALRLCVIVACAFSPVTNLLHAHSMQKRRELLRLQQLQPRIDPRFPPTPIGVPSCNQSERVADIAAYAWH